jgi:hypothetical protein
MDCQEAKSKLEQCFDDGIALDSELEGHVSGCADCKALADDLAAMDSVLQAMPFEAPDGIEDRVMSALVNEHAKRNRPMVIGAMAAVTLLSTMAINWLIPVREIEQTFLRYVQSWVPNTEWMGAGLSFRDQFETIQSSLVGWFNGIELLSASMMWSALVASIVLLVVMNGICVARLRHTSR